MTGGLRCGRFAFEKAIRSGDTGLSSTAIFTGVMIATWADGDGRSVRPAMETLSAAMGKKSEKTARAAVRELAEGQWLEEVARLHRRPVEYRLTVPSKFSGYVRANKPVRSNRNALPAVDYRPSDDGYPEFPLEPAWLP